jgi:hypothetical protein
MLDDARKAPMLCLGTNRNLHEVLRGESEWYRPVRCDLTSRPTVLLSDSWHLVGKRRFVSVNVADFVMRRLTKLQDNDMQTELLDGCLGPFRIQKIIHISVARFARPIEAKARASARLATKCSFMRSYSHAVFYRRNSTKDAQLTGFKSGPDRQRSPSLLAAISKISATVLQPKPSDAGTSPYESRR